MLNIENNNKAFHISFYPHTSLTAGLNIWENISFKEEEDAYTHLHMQMNMSTGYKPEVQTTIPSKSIHVERKNKTKNIYIYIRTYSKSISQLVHSPFSEQAAFKVGHWSQFLRMEYQTLHYQMPPLWIQTRGPLEILHLLQMSDFWC